MVKRKSEEVNVKPRTKRARRILEKREPKLVEEVKTALLLHGPRTSQTTKDVLADIHKLRTREAVRLSRKNDTVRPFETGGEVELEYLARKADTGLFVVDSHSKKRPHNLIFGRMFDYRLYDLLEFGVEKFRSIKGFGTAGASVQAGNKPCMVFAGEQFENDADFKLAKSMLLDMFRGRVVEKINLKGLDHVIFVAPVDRQLLFRMYAIKLKKSGTKIPRVELVEMGPSMNLALRRLRAAGQDMEREAMARPKTTKKKEKNVSNEMLDGKVGRMYVPRQEIGSIATRKMKGLKRERREAASTAKEQKRQKASAEAAGADAAE
ncbi:g4720 [Coccomyxa viridis]|uniref:Ribosome production factor 2 homolog n=1 Tax=Coccomyxa viridis TaxID=1274662 RepID=A0ABP1FTM6_9CHLO